MGGFFGSFFGDTGGGTPTPPAPTPPTPVPVPVVFGSPLYVDHVALAVDRLCGYARAKAVTP